MKELQNKQYKIWTVHEMMAFLDLLSKQGKVFHDLVSASK